MKKRIVFVLMILLFATGCTCEYNLTIDNNVYKEEINIKGETSNEITNLNKKWQIPVDKEEYDIGTDPSTTSIPTTDTYNYNFTNNTLKLNNDFTKNGYLNSTAVSNCYKKLSIENYSNSTIISTSQNTLCFDKYPSLNNLVINITVDRPVTKNNADSVSGNTYTWNINKSNASKKGINLVLSNGTNENNSNKEDNNINNNINNKRDYTMYIFAGVLLIVMLLAYVIINTIKNKDDNMDD